jgi:hypothetical protein
MNICKVFSFVFTSNHSSPIPNECGTLSRTDYSLYPTQILTRAHFMLFDCLHELLTNSPTFFKSPTVTAYPDVLLTVLTTGTKFNNKATD